MSSHTFQLPLHDARPPTGMLRTDAALASGAVGAAILAAGR